MRLANKVAFITGGASGIGRATAELFAREGARVAVAYHSRQEAARETLAAIQATGGEALLVQADVSDAAQVEAAVDATLQEFGRIDTLVSAAGVLYYGTILETDERDWNRVLSINLTGVYLCARAVVPQMIRRGGGSIINIASTAGTHGSIPRGVAYSASKAGVAALTQAMAIDHARQGLRVNAICPGPTDTSMPRGALTAAGLAHLTNSFPMARLGRPEEVANMALFLASDESSFVTGAVLYVDGGQAAAL